MKKLIKILIIILIILVVLPSIAVLILINMYNNAIKPVSSKSKEVEFEVIPNSTYYSLAKELKEKDLIKSEFFYEIYIKLNKPNSLQAGKYNLNKNMSVEEIINKLEISLLERD